MEKETQAAILLPWGWDVAPRMIIVRYGLALPRWGTEQAEEFSISTQEVQQAVVFVVVRAVGS